jgi:lactoylglutathione lyase
LNLFLCVALESYLISHAQIFILTCTVSQQESFFGRRGGFVRTLSSTEAGAAGNMAQTSTTVKLEEALDWVKKDNRRLLHVVYRVGDLDKTIK